MKGSVRLIAAFALFFAVFSVACGIGSPPGQVRLYAGAVFEKSPSNPLVTASPGGWDEYYLESPMVIKEGPTYYMYYHATSQKANYRVGLATASRPDGPWTKYGQSPILDVSEPGSWDDASTAIGHVMKVGKRFYMWYMAQHSGSGDYWPWNIGVATADSPAGPWVKYAGNPVLTVGAPGEWDSRTLYVGSVVSANGQFYMYYVGFQKATDGDGQIGLATAPAPTGPWTKYAGNPIFRPDGSAGWKAGQVGEIAATYMDGMFHAWYAGYPEQSLKKATLGYAYSRDGVAWTDGPRNPVLTGDAGKWDEDRISEPHLLVEDEKLYLFFTGANYSDGQFAELPGMAWARLDALRRTR